MPVPHTYKYVEYCVNTYRSNRVFDYTQIKRTDFEGSTDCYMSAFRFPVEFKNYVDTTHTVSNYGGKCYADFIYCDFDCESDLHKAQTEIQKYITAALGEIIPFEESQSLRISFSGAKGFTLAIPIEFISCEPSEDFNEKAKSFVFAVAELCPEQLTTLDRKIYDKIRVIRLNNTINSKTGLYKIPLTIQELFKLSIDEIKELAKQPRTIEYRKEIKPSEQLSEIFNSFSKPVYKKTDNLQGLFESVEQGERNNKLFTICNRLHYHGLPESYIRDIALMYNSRLSNPLEAREVEIIIKSNNKYPVKEKTEDVNRKSFYNFEDREQSYINYIQNLSERRIDLGFIGIDAKMRGIRPGNVVTLLAQTGIGKSVIAQNIIHSHLEHTEKLCLFFSIEMDEVEVFERELQIEHEMTGYDIEASYKSDMDGMVKRNKLLIGKNNNFICITNPVEISEIPKYTETCSNIFGKEIDLIIVDYLGLVTNKPFDADEYKKTTDNIRKIRDYAKQSKIPAVILSQIGRNEANKNRITLFGGKGSGDIENSSNVILALDQIDIRFIDDAQYRKEFDLNTYDITRNVLDHLHNNYKQLLMLTILKNRRGGKTEKLIVYDKKSLRMSELTKTDLIGVNPF